MQQYNITGMSCAACSVRVEKAVLAVQGVRTCAVSLLTHSMRVEGSAPSNAVIAAVTAAGYGASLKDAAPESPIPNALADTESPRIRKRLIASVILLLPLMWFSMGHNMLGLPLPALFEGNPIAIGIAQMLFAAAVMVVNRNFFVSGLKGVLHRAPNMDTLVAMGSGVSFLWSVYVLLHMTRAAADGSIETVMADSMQFYFESAAMILTLISVGKLLEALSKGKTTDALRGLMQLSPDTATLVRDGKEVEVPVAEVQVGDVFIVRPGGRIPVDGIVLEGESAVSEAMLTGESVPADKAAGDKVSAATANQSGFLRCQATRIGKDTALAQIIQMVEDASATKAPAAKLADKVSGIFVPAVIGIALVTLGIWLAVGQTFGYALARAIAVLVISCPCALGLATPVSIMVGSGVGARNGILFKTAVSLEETGKIQIAALDKTGTITSGEPAVTDVIPANLTDMADLRDTALALEQKSEHPLAKAILRYGEECGVSPKPAENFAAVAGNGLTGSADGHTLCGGNLRFIKEKAHISPQIEQTAADLAEQGKTPLFFARDGILLGIIAVADRIKPDSAEAVAQLRQMGLRVVMLTGDNERTAAAVGREAGVDAVIAGVLPDGKETVIRRLQAFGKVAMVGDGINDAPALTRADIGIAIGAGTDVAVDAADVVLMKSALSDAAAAVRLSRTVLRNVRQNLFWAFLYNIIGIPLAAGAWVHLLGWELNPMYGAAAMSLSSFCVVTNALRLNLCKVYDARRDRHRTPPDFDFAGILPQDEPAAAAPAENTLTLHIDGMMCEHCEMTVKDVLEAFDAVKSAEVSHVTGTAVLHLIREAPLEEIRRALAAEDYTCTGVL